MTISNEKLTRFNDMVFSNIYQSNYAIKYDNNPPLETKSIKYGDMYNIMLDFIKENNINLNLDEDDFEYYISILTTSLFCSLKSTSQHNIQSLVPRKFIINLIAIMEFNPEPLDYMNMLTRALILLSPSNEEEVRTMIPDIANNICNDITNYNVIQENIYQFLESFNMDDDTVNWICIGMLAFLLTIREESNKINMVTSYLNNLIDFVILSVNYDIFDKPNYREFIDF